MQDTRNPTPRLVPSGALRVGVLLAMVRHHWFIRIRWLITVAIIPLLLIGLWQVPDFKGWVPLMVCLGALALVNLIWSAVGRALVGGADDPEATSPVVVRRATVFANAQMTVDLLLLTLILRYSGGIENPMSVFYLFHMMIAVLLLTPRNANLQGCWALVLYSTLGVGECVGFIHPHYPFLASTVDSGLHTDWLYVLCGIGVLGAAVSGTLYFTWHISKRIDAQERELWEANANLLQSQVAIQDLQARRSRFMLTAAHQLKGPLAGIETLASLISDNVVDAGKTQGIVARIIARCRQAIVQVTELLTLARVQDAPPAKHREARTDVAEVVHKVVGLLAEQAAAKNLVLQVEVSPPGADAGAGGTLCAAIESRDLDDCLTNLVDNAIKYTPEGGSVWVKISSDEHQVMVSVRDTGVGIAEGSEDDIFDPFRRGNLALASNIPGSGLGLAIVREVVEQARGKIEVRSTVGKGSEFTVSFPRHDAQASVVRGTRAAKLNRPSSPAT